MIVGDERKHLAALLTLRFVTFVFIKNISLSFVTFVFFKNIALLFVTSVFILKNISSNIFNFKIFFRTVADPAGEPNDELADSVKIKTRKKSSNFWIHKLYNVLYDNHNNNYNKKNSRKGKKWLKQIGSEAIFTTSASAKEIIEQDCPKVTTYSKGFSTLLLKVSFQKKAQMFKSPPCQRLERPCWRR